jgi:hypothetical protein
MRWTVPVLMLVGAAVAEPHALERRRPDCDSPAEAYADAELLIVINYLRWLLRRKRN